MSAQSDSAEAVRIEMAFSFHPATPDTGPKHDAVREECKRLALWIERNVPNCRERTVALAHVQGAMWACNAAVAIDGAYEAQRQQAMQDAARDV